MPIRNSHSVLKRVARHGLVLVGGLALGVGCATDGGTGPGPGPGPGPSPTQGTITGTVVSSATGTPIASATVQSGGATTTTDGSGRFSLTVDAGDRVVVRMRAPGFAATMLPIRVQTGQSTRLPAAQLLPVGVSQSMSVAAGGTVAVPSSPGQVVLPGNGLTPVSGTAASNVTVEVTPINPATDVDLMPGDYTAQTGAGTQSIESFGAMLISISDAAGNRYNLRPSTTATVRIPLGTRSADPPASIPMFYLDETTARWVQEGTATLQGAGADRYYEGTVSHFSYWNADYLFTAIQVTGCVRDAANQPVANAYVRSDGIDYTGAAQTYTGSDGSFSVAMRPNSKAAIKAWVGTQYTNTVTAGPSATNIALPACLTSAPDYTLSLTPAALTVAPGATGNTTVTITRSNFTGVVTLSLANAPAGVTGSFSPAAPTGAGTSSTLTVSVGAAVPTGTYSLTVNGTATAGNRSTPLTLTVSASSAGHVTVDAGARHSCTLNAAGQAYCWGLNDTGRLGDGTTTERRVPTPVAGSLTFAALSAGFYQTCGVTTSGAAYCWGGNNTGQVGDATTTDRLVPTLVAGGLTFAAVTAGAYHTCGVTTSGAAYCWGGNFGGALGDGTTTARIIPTPVAGDLTFATLSAGYFETCGVTTSGVAYCWGINNVGQLGDGTQTNRLVPTPVAGGLTFANVSAAVSYACGVTTSGAAYCWGSNSNGQLGDNTTTDRFVPTVVVGGLTFAVVSAGDYHDCGVTTSGAAYCWGLNGSGQLGDGTITDRHVPTAVAGGLTFAAVSAGDFHTCGVTTSDALYCWGYNVAGQVGDGTATNRFVPTAVAPPGTAPTPDYTLSLAPTALTIAPGANDNTTVSISRTNFTGAVTLSLGNAPAGVTGSFNPTAPTGTSSTLTVSVGAAVGPGVYNLTVGGTGTAGDRSTPLTLTVSPVANYSLSLTPAAVTIAPGANDNTTVTITRTNFTGAVTLSLGNAPAGVTGSFNPAAPTGTSSTLTVSVGAAVGPGVYNLTVDGTGTAGNRSAPLTLTVSAGTARIVGEVRDAVTFSVISGATVRLGPAGVAFTRQVATGTDGSFVFDGVAPGTYQAQATAAGYVVNDAANLKIVEVAGGDVARADFALPPVTSTQRFGSLSGRVTIAGGVALAGANVTISGGAQTNGVFRATTTKTDGTYALTGIVLDDVNGVPIASFSVEASSPGYVAQSRAVTLVQNQTVTNVDFQLSAGQTGTTFFSDGFETATAWVATGFWNRSTLSQIVNAAYPAYVDLAPDDNSGGSLPAPFSGSFGFWYGDPTAGNFLGTQSPFDAGKSGGTSTARNSGTLKSPDFTIPASAPAATLRFDTWFEIESVNPNSSGFDIMSISVQDVGTGVITELGRLNPFEDPTFAPRNATPYTSAGFNRAPVWRPVFVNLNAFRGKLIRLEFTFDTVDPLYNGFRGWIIDNVEVSDQAIPGATAAVLTSAPAATAKPHTRGPRNERR